MRTLKEQVRELPRLVGTGDRRMDRIPVRRTAADYAR